MLTEKGKVISMEDIEGSKRSGRFTLPTGQDIYGELTFAGPHTNLYLQDGKSFDIGATYLNCIKGILNNFTKISLIQCNTYPESGHSSRQGSGIYYSTEVFPHFVVYGDHHIDPEEKTITHIRFIINDSNILFNDVSAFGRVKDARPYIEQISRANCPGDTIPIGPNPIILYFTGKQEIFSAETVLGVISASHSPIYTSDGSDDLTLKKIIFVTLAFREAVAFDDAISKTIPLLRFLELLVGRPQNLLELNLGFKSDHADPSFLKIYWSVPPKRQPSNAREDSRVTAPLLDAIRQPEKFSRIIESWFKMQQDRNDSRCRFHDSFAKQASYDIDRLIGCANMFDILPSSAFPPEIDISEEMKLASEKCREIFKNLPLSLERNSVLKELGRIGQSSLKQSSLKQKIRHRVKIISDIAPGQFPELPLVTDQAVDCRNHYVHGSKPRLDYNGNFSTVVFFTAALEFVFAISDLIDSGWDVNAWSERHNFRSHPFDQFRFSYADNLRNLKALLPKPEGPL